MVDAIHSTDKAPVQPALYIVATPIGNLRDITLRALDVLAAADAVVCEDSRVTGKLLSAYNIKKPMIVYNDHADEDDRARIIAALRAGDTIALVSDAGTPLLSDPGYKLVHAAMTEGLSVVPVPGASALLPALQLSALPTDRFFFGGFLPHKQAARQKAYAVCNDLDASCVFYESPNRMEASIADAFAVLGDRPVALCRELTKMFEEARHGTLAAWAADPSLMGTLKGECVLVIGAGERHEFSEDYISAMLSNALKDHSLKDAVALVCDRTGAPKKRVYDLALKIRDGQS